MAVPRISALLMLRSTISTVSAPATCLFRGSITNPAQLLCTLRGRRYRRLTQHLLPGGPLRPYPDRSCTGWTAPAFVGAFGNCGPDRRRSRSGPHRSEEPPCSAAQAGSLVAGACHILGVAATVLANAFGREFQHPVGQCGEEMPVVGDEQHGALVL